jgi:hypothetical protein
LGHNRDTVKTATPSSSPCVNVPAQQATKYLNIYTKNFSGPKYNSIDITTSYFQAYYFLHFTAINIALIALRYYFCIALYQKNKEINENKY